MAAESVVDVGGRIWMKVVNADGSDYLDENGNLIYVDEAGTLFLLHFIDVFIRL